MTNSIVNAKSAGIISDVRTLGTFPGAGLGQIGVELDPEVRV